MSDSLYSQMLRTAGKAGIDIIGKDKAVKLLALCFAFGDEAFVFADKLHEDVMFAADRYGIAAMSAPNQQIAREISQRVREIRTIGKPEWVSEIEAEYHIEFPRWKENDVCIPESVNRKAGRS